MKSEDSNGQRVSFSLENALNVLRRRRKAALYAFGAVVVLAALYVATYPVTCEAVAELRFEPPAAAGAGDVPENWDEVMESRLRAIKRFSVIRDAALLTGLIAEDSPIDEVHQAVRRLRERVMAERVGATNAVRIRVRSGRPKDAVETADAVAAAYVTQCGVERKAESEKASALVDEQLDEARTNLGKAEAVLKKTPGLGKDAGKVQGVRKALEHREQRLGILLQEYTAEYPAVVEVKEQIAQLEERLKKLTESEQSYTRAKSEAVHYQDRVAALTKQLETARSRGANRIPEVSVADPAVLPAPPDGVRHVPVTIAAVLLALLAALAAVVVPEILRSVPESARKSMEIEELKVSLEKQGLELNRFRRIAQEKESLETVRTSLERQLEVQAGELESLQKIARDKEALERTREGLETALRERGLEIEGYQKIEREKEELEQVRAELEKKLEDREREFEENRRAARERAGQEQTDLEKSGAELRKKIGSLETEIERYRALEREKEDLLKVRADLEKTLEQRDARIAQYRVQEREWAEWENTGAGLARKLAKEEREELRRRIEEDRKAADRIRAALEAKLDEQAQDLEEFRRITEEKDALQREMEDFRDMFEARRTELEKSLSAQEKELKKLQAVAKEKEQLETSTANLKVIIKKQAVELTHVRREAEDTREEYARNGTALEKARADLEKKLREREQDLARFREIEREKEKLEETVAALQKDVDGRELELADYRSIVVEQKKIEEIKAEAQRYRKLIRVFDTLGGRS